jgi:hypothetical protein
VKIPKGYGNVFAAVIHEMKYGVRDVTALVISIVSPSSNNAAITAIPHSGLRTSACLPIGRLQRQPDGDVIARTIPVYFQLLLAMNNAALVALTAPSLGSTPEKVAEVVSLFAMRRTDRESTNESRVNLVDCDPRFV